MFELFGRRHRGDYGGLALSRQGNASAE
jgi:hypothetical protein